jgi:hypothetical protein
MSTAAESFVEQLYEMSGAKLKAFNRYKVGYQIGLDREQTDAVVEELAVERRIKKMEGMKIMLTPEEKNFIDDAKGLK